MKSIFEGLCATELVVQGEREVFLSSRSLFKLRNRIKAYYTAMMQNAASQGLRGYVCHASSKQLSMKVRRIAVCGYDRGPRDSIPEGFFLNTSVFLGQNSDFGVRLKLLIAKHECFPRKSKNWRLPNNQRRMKAISRREEP